MDAHTRRLLDLSAAMMERNEFVIRRIEQRCERLRRLCDELTQQLVAREKLWADEPDPISSK